MTALTPLEVFAEAVECGLKLGIKPPNTLTVEPTRLCTPEFAATLKARKPVLLALLRLPFVIAYSQILKETIFFCEDENVKAALVEAGADSLSIYTKEELRVLVAHNRVKPFLPDELCKLHEIKRTFHGRIAE